MHPYRKTNNPLADTLRRHATTNPPTQTPNLLNQMETRKPFTVDEPVFKRMKLGVVPLSVLVAFVALLHTRLQETHPDHVFQFQILAALSIAGYFLALKLIPTVSVMCVEKGDLWGRDINKVGDTKMFVTPFLPPG
jgi:hypothetical protein